MTSLFGKKVHFVSHCSISQRSTSQIKNSIVIFLKMADTLGGLFIAWLVYVVVIVLFIVIPAALNISLGARYFYTRFLVKIIKVHVQFGA